MELELTTYKLGELLKKVSEKYGMTLMAKIKLSGGFMTMFGDVEVGKAPVNALSFNKGNNIIELNVKTGDKGFGTVKITGMKEDFKVTLAETRYKEICKGKFSEEVKINNSECKIKIDEDMIFTVKATIEELKELIK